MDRCWCGNTILDDYSANYFVCKNCNSLITKADISYNPDQINDDEDFYGKQYWETKMTDAAQVKNTDQIIDLYLHERAVYWLKHLFFFVLPGHGHIAETGCGLGQFSYLLKECGYEQTAYELSPAICNLIRNTLDINIICGAFKKSDVKYDAICAFDVMEHLQNPHEFLDSAMTSLKDKGIMMLQMPCYDDEINFDEMRQKKPRFLEQMKEKEHVYLYSKKSIKKILKGHGLDFVEFIEPFFGEDYDMFIVASPKPIVRFQAEEIDNALNKSKHGRLIKALMECWNEARNNMVKLQASESDRAARMEKIKTLTGQLQESETDRAARMNQIENLTSQLLASESDRTARMDQIESLTSQLKESEADRAARMDQIENLTNQLLESEKDRSDRWTQIQELTKNVRSLEEHTREMELRFENIKKGYMVSEERRQIAEERVKQLLEESIYQKIVREHKEKRKK